MTVIHNDANGLDGRQRVPLQPRVAVDSAELAPADVIVEGRKRQNLDLVVDFLHALNLPDHALRVTLERRPGNLAEKGNVVSLNLEANGVKHVIIGEHQDL